MCVCAHVCVYAYMSMGGYHTLKVYVAESHMCSIMLLRVFLVEPSHMYMYIYVHNIMFTIILVHMFMLIAHLMHSSSITVCVLHIVIELCSRVLNTDNMSIVGVTIDYGPYGFLDRYNPGHICNGSG